MIGPQVPLLRLKDPYFNLKARVQDFKEVYQNFESYKSTRVRNALLLTLGTVVAAAIVAGLILRIMAGSHVAIITAAVIGLTAWFLASYIEHRHDPTMMLGLIGYFLIYRRCSFAPLSGSFSNYSTSRVILI